MPASDMFRFFAGLIDSRLAVANAFAGYNSTI